MRCALNPRSSCPLLRGIYLTDTGGSQYSKKGKRKGKGMQDKEKHEAQCKPEWPLGIQTGLDRYKSQF
ncbi:hypothetical protein K435DRAFT_778250, partial [Dendrothele bispora CBS 962.96]